MADFCNKCAYDMWGEELPADIDVPVIFRNLPNNMLQEGFICEGCGLCAVGKHEEQLYIAFIDRKEVEFANLNEYIIPKNKRVKLCQKFEK